VGGKPLDQGGQTDRAAQVAWADSVRGDQCITGSENCSLEIVLAVRLKFTVGSNNCPHYPFRGTGFSIDSAADGRMHKLRKEKKPGFSARRVMGVPFICMSLERRAGWDLGGMSSAWRPVGIWQTTIGSWSLYQLLASASHFEND